MVQRVEAWGNVIEFPDGMSDGDIAAAIQKNEANLNPDASTFTKAKSAVSGGIDAGLSMLTPKRSIADQAQEQSAATAGLSAPQVKGAPVRRDFYNRMVENPVENAAPGIISRVRDAAASDTKAQGNKRTVAKALVSSEPVDEEGGFLASAGRTVGQNIKGAGQVAADFIPGVGQDNAVKRFGQDVIDANPTAVNSLEDIADKPGTAITEATGNAAPSMAGMVGARALGQGITALSPLAGPAAPVVAAVGQVVSWLGPAAIASLPSYGGIRDKQILDDPKNEESAKAKAIAALGAGAVGAIEQAFGPQQWALAALTKEGRVQLAKKFAATSLPGAIGKGVVKGAAIEGAEELAQNPIEQLAAFDDPTTPENVKDTLFGGAMGALGGGVLGGGIPIVAGKPVTEHSDNVLKYTAARGSERAKAAAQAELNRRAAQGVDPAVANAPESTSDAVDRIISTGKDKAQEIRDNAAASPDAIQSGIFEEEPDHIVDANKMVDESQQAAPDAPTPEPVETLNAQLNALAAGNKPGMLLTPGEPMPDALPDGVKAAEIPGRGTLLYRDDATLQAALNGQMGTALGYGIDEKPATATHTVTARDQNGTVIQDVVTDGRPEVAQAAADVAGENGSVEVRPVEEAMTERAENNGKKRSYSNEYEKRAEMIARQLQSMGLQVRRDSSRVSGSEYIEVLPDYEEDPGGNETDKSLNGRVIKIRVSNHKLPSGYPQADFDAGAKITDDHQDMAGDWLDAVAYVSKKTGAPLKGAAKTLYQKRQNDKAVREHAAAVKKQQYFSEAAIRNKVYLAAKSWLESLDSDVQIKASSNNGKWNALRDGKILSTFGDKPYGMPNAKITQEQALELVNRESRQIEAALAINNRTSSEVPPSGTRERAVRADESGPLEPAQTSKATGSNKNNTGEISSSQVTRQETRPTSPIRPLVESLIKRHILREIAEATKPVNALNTQPGGALFERFAALGDEIGTAEQALADAEELTGLRLGLPIAFVKLDLGTPARFMAESRTIEVSRDWKFTRSEGAQYLAEELFHSVDSLSTDRALSASSKRFDMKTGDIAQEVIKHWGGNGSYAAFFGYPLGRNDLTDSRKKAELFARLGVLYFGEPARMQRYLPTAFGAFNEIFKFSIHPVTGEISRSLWSFAGGRPPLGSEHGANRQDDAGSGGISQSGQKAELGRLRKSIWKQFKADPLGGKVSFSRVDTRSFKARLQEYKEKNARKPFKERLSAHKEKQREGSVDLRGGSASVFRGRKGNESRSSEAAQGNDISERNDPARIAQIRKRLKATSFNAQQATQPGGLSVSGSHKSRVAAIVDAIRSQWKNAPEIVVVDDMSDPAIRKAVRDENERQLSQGATGQPEGFFDQGKVYIVASEMNSPADVVRVLFHETLGHFGLRGAFGKELRPILKQIAALRRADVEAKAKQYGLDMSVEKDRLTAAEEVLAEFSQSRPEISFVRKAIAVIRSWLRKNIPGFSNIEFSDAEIIRNFIIPARGHVEMGLTKSGNANPVALDAMREADAAFSRQSLPDSIEINGKSRPTRNSEGRFIAQTEEDIRNFWKWFGDSVMVDGEDRPLVVYHGTSERGIVDNIFNRKHLGDNTIGNASSTEYAATSYAGFWFNTGRVAPDLYDKHEAVYLKIENPLEFSSLGELAREIGAYTPEEFEDWSEVREAVDEWIQDTKDDGYDGVKLDDEEFGGASFIAFDSTQIKSATANRGTFDADSPNIMFSRSASTPAGSRSTGFPESAGDILADFKSDIPLKAHRDYKAAKAGDTEAAVRVVKRLVRQSTIEEANKRFGADVVYVPVMAQEATGNNQLPSALAMLYSDATGGKFGAGIYQVNRVYHTGADAMERLIARSEFDGPVEKGTRYVLVDDVSTMGGTLADMAAYIQSQGGIVVGAVTMTNSSRSGKMSPESSVIRKLEERHGQEISNIFHIEPSALTRDEAQYLLGFRTTDELRNRAVKAVSERRARLDAKALPQSQSSLTPESGDTPRFSRSARQPGNNAEEKSNMATNVASLQKQLRAADREIGSYHYDSPKREIAEKKASELRKKLFDLTGDPYGEAKKVKPRRPSDDALYAEYATPEEIPNDVWDWVTNYASLLYSDASDAVRWGRIADTLRDERYPSGEIIIYRAVAEGDEIRPGDWVTTDRSYAQDHLERSLGGLGEILEETVNGRDVLVSPTGNEEEDIYAPRSISGPRGADIRFSRSGNNASWDAPEPSKIDDLIYKLQNKHVDLKRVMEAVRNTGAQLADKWNTYLQEELFHGRAAKRTQDFVNKELKPIIAGLKLRGLTVDELDKYLHARHAEEANELIAQRDPNMPDGGSGMTTQEAKDYLTNLPAEKKRKLEQVAAKVDAVIAQTRDLYVSYGLIDQATADSWESMFQHYVPLMREDHDGGMGIGQGFSIKGKEVKHRTGSKRKVVDILANIALQRERAIVRGEKNRVAVSLAGLAKLNPNPDFWTFDKVPTERILNEATGLVEERPVPMFKSRDNVVIAKIKDSSGKVVERAVIFNESDERAMRMAQALKNLDATQLDGLLGVSAKITRYFAAINTQYNPVFGIVNLTRDLQASLINLSSTPIAGHKAQVLKNVLPAIRAIYSSTRGDRKGKQAASPMAALWDEMQQEGGMTGYRDLFKTSEDRANAIKRELDPTAWMNSGLGKIFTAGGALKVPLAIAQKRAGWLFDWLSDYNQTLEGAMRLSVYKTGLDNGMSKQQAASLAKNISVNFNRKGQSGQQAGALYAFFNAAMQGTARIGETMTTMEKGDIKTFRFNRAGKRLIAGGITLGAMQALALAAAGFDDDEPPEFVRERSLILPIGDKKYITVPMPLGFHAIPNIGRISTEYALGGFKNPAGYTAKLFAVFAEAFNPIGSAGFSIQTIAPTAIDPFVALSENKDWTGKPIAKEDFNKLSPTPGFSRNKDTASDPAKWIAEAINTITGGNKYVPGVLSPTADQIDYLAGQVTGGVGRESGKLNQSIRAAVTGEELPPHKIPLVGRFYGNSENQSSQGNAFYSNLKRINEVEAELKGRRKDRLPIDEFKIENPEYRLVVRANLVERLVSKQRKLKSELIEKDAPKEQVKAIDERITKLMAGFNQRVKELHQQAQ